MDGFLLQEADFFSFTLDVGIKNHNFAPPLNKKVSKNKDDSVAQQVEHIPFKDGVLGSSPSWVTLKDNKKH